MTRSAILQSYPYLPGHGEPTYACRRIHGRIAFPQPLAPMANVRASPMTKQSSRSSTDDCSRSDSGNSSSNGSSTRRRVNVACGRCRKRKIRCSGDPGDNSGCNACRTAGMVVGSCVFLRVQCEAREIMSEQQHGATMLSNVYEPSLGHNTLYEPLQSNIHPFTAAMSSASVVTAPPLSMYQTPNPLLPPEQHHSSSNLMLNAPQSLLRGTLQSRSVNPMSMGNVIRHCSNGSEATYSDLIKRTSHQPPELLLSAPQPVSANSMYNGDENSHYCLRDIGQDGQLPPGNFYPHWTSHPSSNYNGTQNMGGRGMISGLVYYDQNQIPVTSAGVQYVNVLPSTTRESSSGVTIDTYGPFPGMASLSISSERSSTMAPALPVLSDRITLPSLPPRGALKLPDAIPNNKQSSIIPNSSSNQHTNIMVENLGQSVYNSNVRGNDECIEPYPQPELNPPKSLSWSEPEAVDAQITCTATPPDGPGELTIRHSSSYPSFQSKLVASTPNLPPSPPIVDYPSRNMAGYKRTNRSLSSSSSHGSLRSYSSDISNGVREVVPLSSNVRESRKRSDVSSE